MLIAVFVIFVILGGYFAGSESAFSAMNKIRIKNKAENDGDRRAKNAMYIANNFDRSLTTLLIGNNITHIAAASVATLFVTQRFGDSETVTLVSTIITTGIVFLFSEMIPKSFANDRSETMALVCAASLRVLMKVFAPLVAFFTWISNAVSRLFRSAETPSITEDELYDIIDTAEEQGVVNEEQSDLLKSVLDFSDTTAADVMTMREDIAYLDVRLPNRKLIESIRQIPHSRILMVDGSLDNVVGVLNIRSFLRAYMADPRVSCRSVLLKPHFVNSTDSINELLDSMRQHKIYLGIVRDEDHRVCGVVTIEDFLEELVGEIWDEEDVVDNDFYKLGGNRFAVSAKLNTGDVFTRIGIPCPDPRIASYTVGVWVTDHFGHLPEEEDSFLFHNVEVTVEKAAKNHLITVVLHVLDEDELAELQAAAAERPVTEK